MTKLLYILWTVVFVQLAEFAEALGDRYTTMGALHFYLACSVWQ